jgi:hypothetical protein
MAAVMARQETELAYSEMVQLWTQLRQDVARCRHTRAARMRCLPGSRPPSHSCPHLLPPQQALDPLSSQQDESFLSSELSFWDND